MSGGSLQRVLKLREVLALSFGAMIGWSWVALTGTWISQAGALGAATAFLIGGVAVVLIGLTYAELAAAMPRVGGEHVYSYRAMGAVASFVCTWGILMGYVAVVAFEAVALPTVLSGLAPGLNAGYLWTIAGWDVYASWVAIGVAGAALVTWVNVRGVRTAASMQLMVVIGLLVAGFMVLLGGIAQGSVENFMQGPPMSVASITGVMLIVPFMFVGFDVIPQAAEEIDLPSKEIGKALMLSVLVAVVRADYRGRGLTPANWPAEHLGSCHRRCGHPGLGFGVDGQGRPGCRGCRYSHQLECFFDGRRSGYLRPGSLRHAAPLAGGVASSLWHTSQGDYSYRHQFHVCAVVWPADAGLGGQCRRSGYRDCLRYGGGVVSDTAS